MQNEAKEAFYASLKADEKSSSKHGAVQVVFQTRTLRQFSLHRVASAAQVMFSNRPPERLARRDLHPGTFPESMTEPHHGPVSLLFQKNTRKVFNAFSAKTLPEFLHEYCQIVNRGF